MFRLGSYQQSLSAIRASTRVGRLQRQQERFFLNFDCKADASRDVQEALDRPSD
jgi:hypothetical protein